MRPLDDILWRLSVSYNQEAQEAVEPESWQTLSGPESRYESTRITSILTAGKMTDFDLSTMAADMLQEKHAKLRSIYSVDLNRGGIDAACGVTRPQMITTSSDKSIAIISRIRHVDLSIEGGLGQRSTFCGGRGLIRSKGP